MSIDLNFWKYEDGIYLNPAQVYQKACCGHEEMEGLEALPIEDILKETAAAFHDWKASGPFDYEKTEGPGSFQISTTPQTVRFDCYAMEQADLKRFSALMAKFGCPLYDPQQEVRFDKIAAFLVGEAADYKTQIEQAFSRLFPRLEVTARAATWEECVLLSKEPGSIKYNAIIHRAKNTTKVTSYLQFGKVWTNRSCQCKTAQLEDNGQAYQLLEGLLQKSLERAAKDFRERTYYE